MTLAAPDVDRLPLRRDLIPASVLPLAYFALAHVGFAAALVTLAAKPGIPGGFFYHPQMLALVHAVTLAWISGSILGAFYIVSPLALRMGLAVGALDWAAFASFWVGVALMVAYFWTEDRDRAAAAAVCVIAAIGYVAGRAWRGLRGAPVPWAVKFHVILAFANILAAALLGILIALDRSRGFLGVSPLASVYAHAHLAAVGWALMMVVGLSYRLIPMMLPAQPPRGIAVALSAIAIEAGVLVVVTSLLANLPWLTAGGLLIAAGIGFFVVNIRRTLAARVRRPPTLPRRDWSVWQTHAALLWLVGALVLGLIISTELPAERRVQWIWCYGVAGLLGFLAQVVVGMQGRLVPMYAWYREFAARGGAPPERAANAIPSPAFARTIFVLWTAGLPLLAWGLVDERRAAIATAGGLLACAVAVGGAYLAYMHRVARVPVLEERRGLR